MSRQITVNLIHTHAQCPQCDLLSCARRERRQESNEEGPCPRHTTAAYTIHHRPMYGGIAAAASAASAAAATRSITPGQWTHINQYMTQ